jgi:primosomal protein N'
MEKLNPPICPFCGAELKIIKNGRFRYFIRHKCKSGLTVSVPLGNKKDVLAIASKRAEQKENKK